MPAPFISRSVTQAASPRIAAQTGKPCACVGTDMSSTAAPRLAKRRAAHARIDVRLGIMQAKTFLEHADAQPFDAAVERRGVMAGGDAALPRIDAVWSGDDSEQQRIVAHIGGHRPAYSERHFERGDAGIRHQAEGRLQADDAAKARRNT